LRQAWPFAVQAILAHTATPAGADQVVGPPAADQNGAAMASAEQAIGQSNVTLATEQAVSQDAAEASIATPA
jgi:hypothetical protein